MSPNIVVYTLLAFLSSSLLENATAQHDSWSFIKSLDALKNAVENLQTKIELQADLLSSLVTKAEMQETSFVNLEAKVDELKTLLLNSTVKEEEQVASLSKLEQQSERQVTSLNKVQAGLENQTTVLNTLATKEEMQANKLTKLESKVAAVGDGVDMLTLKMRATKGIVEGLIAGTSRGVVIIPLDSMEQRIISSNNTWGVAFNWQSRKVYWIEYKVGIRIADLDGGSSELLIADSSYLCGLAVDQITGNLYYMVQGSDPRIRVCDSRGKKCVNAASLNNTVAGYTWHIALFPSKGLMFWSSPSASSSTKSVFRANMDGSNASVFIVEHLRGLYIDELTERLYWTNTAGQSIGNHDLYGTNRNVLLNTTIHPYDLAVDGDTLYFGGQNPNGVYSVTSNGQVSSIANTTGSVYHIALFGRNQVSSRPNPCKYSVCANLCVLTPDSYTCL